MAALTSYPHGSTTRPVPLFSSILVGRHCSTDCRVIFYRLFAPPHLPAPRFYLRPSPLRRVPAPTFVVDALPTPERYTYHWLDCTFSLAGGGVRSGHYWTTNIGIRTTRFMQLFSWTLDDVLDAGCGTTPPNLRYAYLPMDVPHLLVPVLRTGLLRVNGLDVPLHHHFPRCRTTLGLDGVLTHTKRIYLYSVAFWLHTLRYTTGKFSAQFFPRGRHITSIKTVVPFTVATPRTRTDGCFNDALPVKYTDWHSYHYA